MSRLSMREDVAQLKSMNVPKFSKLQRISPAQGVGSNGHGV